MPVGANGGTVVRAGRGGRDRPVQVAVIDDHPLLIDVLRFGLALDAGFEVCAVGRSFADAEALLASDVTIDVLITDMAMDGVASGIEVIRSAKHRRPGIRVLALSAFGDARMVRDALDAGVDAYLLKTAALGEIKDGIEAVLDGHRVLDPAIHLRSGQTGLTARQLEILDLMFQGKSRKAMAAALHVSENTVKSHTKALFARLGAHNALDALARARKLGWTPPELDASPDDDRDD